MTDSLSLFSDVAPKRIAAVPWPPGWGPCPTRPAVFSADRLHRLELTAVHVDAQNHVPALVVCGLNPSVADEVVCDRTIAKLCRYADSWGLARLVMTNLFSWRSTDPIGLLGWYGGNKYTVAHDIDDNEEHILEAASSAAIVLAGWGGPYSPKPLKQLVDGQARRVTNMLRLAGVKLHYLELTKDKIPRHPLFLKGDLRPVEWT